MGDFIEVRIKKVKNKSPEGTIPIYATTGSAGADLFACLENDMVIKPGERVRIPTGIAIELPEGIAALVFARSGLADKKGLALSNGVGVIDSDFRGEIMVLMVNLGQEDIIVRHGERIAQVVFINVARASFTEIEELGETKRGMGGFGSTGI